MCARPPALRHDGKSVQLAAFGDLNRGGKQFFNGLGKWLADIAAIGQDALNGLQVGCAAVEGKQTASAVGRVLQGVKLD